MKTTTTVCTAQTRSELDKQLAIIKKNDTTKTQIKRAKALYTIAENKLFVVDGAESFREWYNDKNDGTIYGVTYKSALNLINTYKYVWSVKEFKEFPESIATRMITPCKTEKGVKALKALVENEKLKADMTQNAVNELLKKEKLIVPKDGVSRGKKKGSENSMTAELKTALSLCNAYMENNCKNEAIMKQWKIILDAHK